MNATQSIIDKLLPEHLKSVSNEQDWVKARIMISFCAIAFVALLLPLTVQLLDPVQRERSAFMIMTECAILLVLTVKWHRINFRACISVVLFASLLTISAFYVYGQFSMFSTAGVYGDVLLVAAVFLVSLRFAFVLSLISLGILFWLRSKYLGGFFPLIEPDPERYWRALIVDSAASHALTLALCGMSLYVQNMLREKIAKAQDDLTREKISVEEERRRRTVSELASGISHEINNPLTIIMGRNFLIGKYLQTVKPDAPAEVLESVGIIDQSAQRMATIVRTMRFLTDSVRADETPQNIAFHVAHCADSCRELCKELGVSLDAQLPVDQDLLLTYGNVFARSLFPLLENAALAAAASEKKTVGICAERMGNLLRVSVTDSGAGITLDDKASIFDPFVTTRSPGKGVGLGLAVARALAEKSGGTVKLLKSSNPTTFEVTTPIIT